MSDKLEVGNIQAAQGEMEMGYIPGEELSTGQSIDIPVLGMNGVGNGPTLLLFAMQHGVELQNAPIIHKVIREKVDPKKLNGKIIGIPVANPLAYMHHTYRSWIDNEDIGYVPVDNPDGSNTERLANKIWEEAWSQSDLVLNMHSNVGDALPYTAIKVTKDTEDQMERMAEAFGLTTIRYEGLTEGPGMTPDKHEDQIKPTLMNKGVLEGIPMLITETVDGRWITEPSQSRHVEGIINLMKEFDMLEGDSIPGHKLQTELGADIVRCKYTGGSGLNRSVGMIRPDHGGIVHLNKKPGELINKNEKIAEIVDLHGNHVEDVSMPEEGYIWAYPCSQVFGTSGALQTINAGDYLAFAFKHVEH